MSKSEFEKERERRLARALVGHGTMRKAKAELAKRIEARRRAREEKERDDG